MSGLYGEMSAARDFRMRQAEAYGASRDDLRDLYSNLEEEYNPAFTRLDIDSDYIEQIPKIQWTDPIIAVVGYEEDFSEQEMAQIIAEEDLVLFSRAAKDATVAEVETAVIMARAERFMEAARLINMMEHDVIKGE